MSRAMRQRLTEHKEVMFPVTPMLDMAFQLLAFFVLTFQTPTLESRLDMYLPAAPAVLPSLPGGQARSSTPRIDSDLENDLLLRVEADDLGDLKALKLGDAPVPDIDGLGDRLTRYAKLLGDRPLRVRIAADDRLRYEFAARLIAVCSKAGAAAVRLADPSGTNASTAAP
jgi:biopolymer transport protein ExbD